MDGLAHCLGALENAGIGQRAVACHEAADHQRAPYAIRNGAGRCAGKERLLQWRERRSHRRTMPLKMTDRIRRIDKESCGAGVNLRCPTGVLWVGHKKCALSILAMASCSGHRVGYHKTPQRQYRELLGEPVAARCVGEPWSYHLQGSLCDGHQPRARGWGAAWQDGCPRCADRGCEVQPTTEDTLATTWHCCCDSDHKNAHPPADCRNCAGAAMLFPT